MAAELSRATVFALPSHNEGVPMALLEAMSRSLPVLTTPVGGIPEVIENDRNGLMVTPGDVDAIEVALNRLLSSSAERARLGAAARATIAERYSLSAAIERLAALYRFFGVPERSGRRRPAKTAERVDVELHARIFIRVIFRMLLTSSARRHPLDRIGEQLGHSRRHLIDRMHRALAPYCGR